jgi:hypothetical protein
MSEKVLKATHSGILQIGNAEIPCHVLENGERILSTRGVMKSLGRTWRGRKYSGTQLPVFLEAKNLNPYISEELAMVLTPIAFKPKTGYESEGYKAEILPAICDIYLRANDDGVLTSTQESIARTCEILVRALSKVGIIALVDEATGYQDIRARQALQKILEEFIAKELQPWIKTFDDEFYKLIFKLNHWPYTEQSIKKRPGVIGRWTNDIIYARLAPGIKTELHKLTGRDEVGRLKTHLHRHLTRNVGYQKLLQHLSAVEALMRASNDWRGFQRLLSRSLPKYGDQLSLDELYDKKEEK